MTTAVNYGEEETYMFLNSLFKVGYKDQIVILTDNIKRKLPFMDKLLIVTIPLSGPAHLPLNTRRFVCFKEYLALNGIPEQLIVTDIRDVIFQTNPSIGLSRFGVHSYCEYEGMTIGKCPYNGKWIRDAYGKDILLQLSDNNIICAGVINGNGHLMYDYIKRMVDELFRLPPTLGFDQGVHNYLTYTIPDLTIVHANEYGPVYTVGYMPREILHLTEDGKLLNRMGEPCVVHQYDRHKNLAAAFKGIYR